MMFKLVLRDLIFRTTGNEDVYFVNLKKHEDLQDKNNNNCISLFYFGWSLYQKQVGWAIFSIVESGEQLVKCISAKTIIRYLSLKTSNIYCNYMVLSFRSEETLVKAET